MKGYIYKIERLAVYDGPGIRTVIFLKGCPLRCQWCASPESQELKPEMGLYEEKCTGCGACVDICPSRAAVLTNQNIVAVDRKLCTACGVCESLCPASARKIIGTQISVSDVVHELEKDAVFYHRSNGGVTLSGGDPSLQPQFSANILKKAVGLGFHTAMETCGHVQWHLMEKMLAFLDLVYVDLKHMDSKTHRLLTGKGNELILDNIQRIDAQAPGTELVLRIPLIPGVNDSRENVHEIGCFISRLKRVKRLELLPYHRYGVSTYKVVGKPYLLPSAPVPRREHIESLKAILIDYDIPVQIGG